MYSKPLDVDQIGKIPLRRTLDKIERLRSSRVEMGPTYQHLFLTLCVCVQ